MHLQPIAQRTSAQRGSKGKRPLSPGAQLRKKIRDRETSIRRLRARARNEKDPAKQQELQRQLTKAKGKLASARAKLQKMDNAIVGGPQGLRTSGVGIVRISPDRKVDDSQANYRKHKGLRK